MTTRSSPLALRKSGNAPMDSQSKSLLSSLLRATRQAPCWGGGGGFAECIISFRICASLLSENGLVKEVPQ